MCNVPFVALKSQYALYNLLYIDVNCGYETSWSLTLNVHTTYLLSEPNKGEYILAPNVILQTDDIILVRPTK